MNRETRGAGPSAGSSDARAVLEVQATLLESERQFRTYEQELDYQIQRAAEDEVTLTTQHNNQVPLLQFFFLLLSLECMSEK